MLFCSKKIYNDVVFGDLSRKMRIFSRYLLLLFSSGGFMQRQMSPTEGLVKVVKVKMKKSVSARNEFDNFDNYDRFV